MENEKLLLNLANQLEDLKRQVLRMNRKDYDMHRLDIDILQNIIRDLYDQVLELEIVFEKKPEIPDEKQKIVAPVPELEKEPVQPEMQAIVEEEVEEETLEIPELEDEAVAEEETEKETVEFTKPDIEASQVVEFKIEVEKEVIVKEELAEVFAEEKEQSKTVEESNISEMERVRSTIDLFSTTGEPTIFDRISHDKEPSIADKMRQTRIADLRQAIGINEKFLFINELFNGDMGKYNKALDELNEMKTKEGVVTYFIEMKIHNQWKEENEAFIKFKELLDRKIE